MVWKADRHIKYDEKKEGVADMGSIRPYGERYRQTWTDSKANTNSQAEDRACAKAGVSR